MENPFGLNKKVKEHLTRRSASYQRQGVLAKIEAFFLLLMLLLALKMIYVDWILLTMVHETYADESYASAAFALSGLIVVLALNAVTMVHHSPWLERFLARTAAVFGIVFVLGTCAMLAVIALTQGVSTIGGGFPSVEAFFNGAHQIIDEQLGVGIFEEIMVKITVPLFTAAVFTAFYLTTYVLKLLVGILLRRTPTVIRRIAQARQSAALFEEVMLGETRVQDCDAGLRIAATRREHWSDSRVADAIAVVVTNTLRPFDAIVETRLIAGRADEEPDEFQIPHPDGGPSFNATALKNRLGDIRAEMSREKILHAIQEK